MKNVLAVLVAAIFIADAVSALAVPRANQKPTVREVSMDLDYKLGPGTETCYAPRGMEQRIMGALTYDPFRRDLYPELHLGIDVVRQEGTFHAELTMTLANGKRLWVAELSGPHCVLLLGNVSVTISAQVLIYVIKWPEKAPPSAPPAPPAEAPLPPPPHPGQPPSPSAPLSAPASAPRRAKESASPAPSKPDWWMFSVGAGPEVSRGLVPGTGLGGNVSLTGQWREFALVAEARGHWTAWGSNETGRRALGEFFEGTIVACWRRRWFGLCAPVSAGLAIQSIWVYDLSQSYSAPVLGAGGWLSLRLQLKNGLSLQADGRVGVTVITYSHHVNRWTWYSGDSPVRANAGDSIVRANAIAGLSLLWRLPIRL